MRKVFFITLAIFLWGVSGAQERKLDWPMELKRCSIDIKADVLTAITFIEMEFYNPNDVEIEGLYRFKLLPNQVITAFQLELNGKYRDGSIEEKWKATNAYNTIVGKRIDPALLTMEYADNYSLRIYPIPPRSTRKITMTIEELMRNVGNKLLYHLPLDYNMHVDEFKLNAAVKCDQTPTTREGLLGDLVFNQVQQGFELKINASGIKLNRPVTFEIPFTDQTVFCSKEIDGQQRFSLFHNSAVPSEFQIKPDHITVFWDASGISAGYYIDNKINYLHRFMSKHSTKKLTITTFNHRILESRDFVIENSKDYWKWAQYIRSITYNGATQLGCIDLRNRESDLFMLFSDGRNTYGSAQPVTGSAVLNAIHADPFPDYYRLHQAVNKTGGRVIDIHRLAWDDAIKISSKATNWLLKVTSSSGKVYAEQQLPIKLGKPIYLSGTYEGNVDTIYLHYGNNGRVTEIEKIIVNNVKPCRETLNDNLEMLTSFESIVRSNDWNVVREFGLDWKIVTPYTAYIVLERIEDYKKFDIAPPKELEEECEKINYVWKRRSERNKMIQQENEFVVLGNVVQSYNSQLSTWGYYNFLSVDRVEFANVQPALTFNGSQSRAQQTTPFFETPSFGEGMNEVVVTSAFGVSKQMRSSGYTIASVQPHQLDITPQASILAGRTSGLIVTTDNERMGESSDPLRIRGGLAYYDRPPVFVVNGSIVNSRDINLADIGNISVLNSNSATAIYGERAKGGAVIITPKKPRTYRYNDDDEPVYKLKNLEDYDYMYKIRQVPNELKLDFYNKLKLIRQDNGFFYDMAEHFHESGMDSVAFDILMNAAELYHYSNHIVLITIAYTIERWGMFEEAIKIYEQLVNDNPSVLNYKRDLALAYYQSGDVQKAIEIYYDGIKDPFTNGNEGLQLKTLMLAELNAIIAAHRNKLDVSFIPATLINSVSSDLRIILSSNKTYTLNGLKINEPGGVYSSWKKNTKHHGITNLVYGKTMPPVLEYRINGKVKGHYRLTVKYQDHSNWTPSFIRLMVFRNFGKEDQSLEIKNIIMDNQRGEVEIDDFEID